MKVEFLDQTGATIAVRGPRYGRAVRLADLGLERLDLPPGLWTSRDWPGICQEIAAARTAARHHPNTVLGTGPLPMNASSVLVVDASHFTASLDEWMES